MSQEQSVTWSVKTTDEEYYTFLDPLPKHDSLLVIRATGEVNLLGRNIKEMTDKEIADTVREIGRRCHALFSQPISP